MMMTSDAIGGGSAFVASFFAPLRSLAGTLERDCSNLRAELSMPVVRDPGGAGEMMGRRGGCIGRH